jgi:hypothetical protein
MSRNQMRIGASLMNARQLAASLVPYRHINGNPVSPYVMLVSRLD